MKDFEAVAEQFEKTFKYECADHEKCNSRGVTDSCIKQNAIRFAASFAQLAVEATRGMFQRTRQIPDNKEVIDLMAARIRETTKGQV